MTRFGAALLIVSALGFGCSSTIDASNPFDPNAPADTQAKARVVGVLTAADATDGAGVTLTLSANHQVIKQTASGDDGSFVFDAVVPGQYQLDARKDGFAAISIPLTLAPGATADLGHVDLTDTAAPTQPALALVEGDSRQNGLTHVSTVELTLSAAGKAVAAEVSEDPGLAGATTISLPTDPQHPPTLTLTGDGVHTVYARFLDAAGNASDRVSAQVIVDTVAPLSVPPGAPAVVSGTTFQLLPPPAGEDEVEITGDQVLSPTGFVPVTPNLPLSVTVAAGDGGKVLHLRYRDLADNVTTLDPITVVLDTHAPVAVKFPVIGFRANGTTSTSVLASPNVSLDFSAETDAATSISALRVSNRSDLADATFQPFNATIPWILQAGDGPKAVYAQFRDQAGNDSAIVENDGALTLAQTPPAGATLLIDGGATVTNQRYAQSIAISSQVGQGSPPSEMWLSTTGFSGAAGGPRDTGWVPYANTWNPAGSYPGLDLSSGAATSTFSGSTVVVSAKFRNLALVEGGNTSATIVIDDTPPSGGRLRLAGLDSGAGLFTNTPAVTALIDQAAGDPSSMAFAITGGAPCNTDLAFANAVWQPFAPAATLVLAHDGPTNICVLFKDLAGNVMPSASAPSAAITLDTQPPSNPVFLAPAAGFTALTAIDAVFSVASDEGGRPATYQCLGAQFTRWTDCSPALSAPAGYCAAPIDYSNGPPPVQPARYCLSAGQTLLGVRARDAAFNASGGSFLDLTSEPTPPLPPVLTSAVGAETSAALGWTASPSATTVGYKLYYGTSDGDLSGTGASQGSSPIDVGNTTAFSVTGLLTGQPYSFQLRAYDGAGNLSDFSSTAVVVPQRVGPRLLSTYGSGAEDVALVGDHAYLSQVQGVEQLSLASSSGPAVIGRALLRGFVPQAFHSLYATTCSSTGGAVDDGECVYVAGTSLEAAFRQQGGSNGQQRTSVAILFFPDGGTAQDPVAGRVLTTISVSAVLFAVRGTHLYMIDLVNLYDYDVTNPAVPVLAKRGAMPGDSIVGGVGAGLIGNTFLALVILANAGGPGVPAPVVLSTDVTQANIDLQVDARAPLDDFGNPVPFSGSAGVFDGAMYLGYNRLNPDSSRAFVVSRYTLGGPKYPSPDLTSAVLQATTSTPSNRAGISGASGTNRNGVGRVYFFGNSASGPTGQPQGLFGYAVADDGASLTAAALPGVIDGVKATASARGSVDRVFALGSGSANANIPSALYTWELASPPVAVQRPPFADAITGPIAEGEGMLFTSDGPTIRTIDVGNPLLPRLATTTTAPRTGTYSYQSLQFTAHKLYATIGSNPPLVDVFEFDTDAAPSATPGKLRFLGSMTLGSTISGGQSATTPSSRYAFSVSLGGVFAWDTQALTPAAPILPVASSSQPAVLGVARGNDVYVFDGFSRFTNFRVNQPPASSVSLDPIASASVPAPAIGAPATATFAGGGVTLSDGSHVQIVNGAATAAPAFESTLYPIGTGGLQQAGYVVGLGTGDGPRFAQHGAASLDGSAPFSNCGTTFPGTFPGFLAEGAVYFAGCNRNGVQLFTSVSGTRTRLLKQWNGDLSLSQSGALASDGVNTFLANPQGGANGQSLWIEDERGLAEGASSQPRLNGIDGAYGPSSGLVHSGGVVYSLTFASQQATLLAYDASDPASPSPLTRTAVPLTVSSGRSPSAVGQPVTDGASLFIPYEDSTGNDSGVIRVDIRDGLQPVQAGFVSAGAAVAGHDVNNLSFPVPRLGLQRNRLFFAATLAINGGCRPVIQAYDVAGTSLSPLAPITFPSIPNCSPIVDGVDVLGDVVPSGRTLFYIYRKQLVSSRGQVWGLGALALGPTRDGTAVTSIMPGKGALEQPLAFSGLALAGDTAYARAHLGGLASFDLSPVYLLGQPARLLSIQGATDSGWSVNQNPYSPALSPLLVQGPFLSMANGRLSVFDLR